MHSSRTELAARALDAQQGIFPELKAFVPKPFVHFAIPLRRSKNSVFVRRNGTFEYRLVADPRYGLPFGQDRLLPIFVATAFAAAGTPPSNAFTFSAITDILDLFAMSVKGKTVHRIRDWFIRWKNTSLFCDTVLHDGKRVHVQGATLRVVDSYSIWADSHRPNQHTLFQNVVTLHAPFADALRAGLVPVRLDLVRALTHNPSALDLVQFLGFRSFALARTNRADVAIPVFGEAGLIHQLALRDIAHAAVIDDLRRQFATLRAVWPNCPHELSSDGTSVLVRAEARRPLELPPSFRKSVAPWDPKTPLPKRRRLR